MTVTFVAQKTSDPIPFIDLQTQRKRLGSRIEEAINAVLAHGQFILGPEVRQLEGQLAAHSGAKHVIGCSSGTDALVLAMMALGVRPGDAVFCPSFTFAATAEAVALVGATPVFVDILRETYNMDARSLESAIAMIKEKGVLRPVGVIAVDLYGQPADYHAINPIANCHDLWVIADGAQSYGARLYDRRVGTMGKLTTTSFFPAKPLGCYGDGGAIFTDEDELADVVRSLLSHGKGRDKYDNVRIGINGRLDTIQAAILIEKLAVFDEEVELRQSIADRYSEGLKEVTQTPVVIPGATSAWAQYTISAKDRDAMAARLREQAIPTAIYYPRPLHRQTAYKAYPLAPNGLETSLAAARHVLSLPMHPYLDPVTQNRIIEAVHRVVRAS